MILISETTGQQKKQIIKWQINHKQSTITTTTTKADASIGKLISINIETDFNLI